MADVNRDKMIDRLVYSDKVRVNATERPIKTQLYDMIVCPKACLLFYTLKCAYFFFTKRVNT